MGSAVWFDVTLSLPLGLRLDESQTGDAVGVSEVMEGGSTAQHNRRCLLEQDEAKKQMWIQQGDRLLMVNGMSCNTQAEAVDLISNAEDKQNIRLKMSRERTGFIKVMFPEPAQEMTVRPRTVLAKVAEAAGHDVEYGCSDGSCGSCWHVNDRTGEVYVLCQECFTGDIPSRVRGKEDSIFIGEEEDDEETFDNTEPLVLRPCPELHAKAVEEWKAKSKR